MSSPIKQRKTNSVQCILIIGLDYNNAAIAELLKTKTKRNLLKHKMRQMIENTDTVQ